MNISEKRHGIDAIVKYAMALYLEDASIENSLPLPTATPTESNITLSAQESEKKDNRTVSLLDVPKGEEEKPLRHIPIAVSFEELTPGHAAWVSFLERIDSKHTGFTVMGGEGHLFKFEGCCVDGLPSGYGELTFVGGKYFGTFENGLCNGRGVRHYDNGDRYEGKFLNGCPQGQGTKFYANGDQHKGTYEKGERSGPGVFTTFDGKCIARGTFSTEGLEGEGEYIEYDSDESLLEPTSTINLYQKGEFKKGLLNGQGEYKDNDGNHYIGDFQDDEFQGQGTIVYKNGDSLKGTFVSGIANGPGVKKSGDGRTTMKGNFIDCLFEGECEFTVLKDPEGTPDNKVVHYFKGNYSGGKPHGVGYEEENGVKYSGMFKEGKRHGKGVFERTESGDIFSGTFDEGNLEGDIEINRKDNTRWEMNYSKGKPINGIIHYKDGKRERVTFNNEGEISSRIEIQRKSKK